MPARPLVPAPWHCLRRVQRAREACCRCATVGSCFLPSASLTRLRGVPYHATAVFPVNHRKRLPRFNAGSCSSTPCARLFSPNGASMRDHETVRKVLAEIKDDDVAALARRLIAIRSTTFEEGAIADFIAEYMKGIGLEVEMMTVEHPYDPDKQTRQPIGRLRGTGGGPTLMLNAHMDVCHMMPGWTVDP